MNFDIRRFLVMTACLMITVSFYNCGRAADPNCRLTGRLDFTGAELRGPAFLLISSTDDFGVLRKNPEPYIRSVITVPADGAFDVALSDIGVSPGERIYLVGFVDNDYSGGLPRPTPGDYIGFYISKKLALGIRAGDAPDSDLIIPVNRRVYEYTAEIIGSVCGTRCGDVYVIAYNGKIESLDFGKIDTRGVMGYAKVPVTASSRDYRLTIMPYGDDIPLKNLMLFAYLDNNGNGIPDAGDDYGFFKAPGSPHAGLPDYIAHNGGTRTGFDLDLSRRIASPSGSAMTLKGRLDLPAGRADSSRMCVYAVAAQGGFDDLLRDPLPRVKQFAPLKADSAEFTMDLSFTDLKPGDEIMVIAVSDDGNGVVAYPRSGGAIGIYQNRSDFSFTMKLVEGENILHTGDGWGFPLNRPVFDFNATVSGRLSFDYTGAIVLCAYAGELESFDPAAIDMDKIIGYSRMYKSDPVMDYALEILPYGVDLPAENIYLIALLDKNGNGRPDGGDAMAFFSNNAQGIPAQIRLERGTNRFMDIEHVIALSTPSGAAMRIAGSFQASDNADGNAPTFVLVAKTDDPYALFGDPMSAIKAFQKIPAGTSSFDIDLSGSDLVPGDVVMVAALRDRDSTGGFPVPSAGDRVGFYQNVDIMHYQYTITLNEGNNIVNPDGTREFTINKILYDYDTSIRFRIDPKNPDGSTPAGLVEGSSLIALAVHRNGINDQDIFSDYMINDAGYILGYERLVFHEDPNSVYQLKIFNAIDERISDTETMPVYVYVIFDRDADGLPDTGEDIAAYWKTEYFIITTPKIWDLYSNGINVLSGPATVKFLGKQL